MLWFTVTHYSVTTDSHWLDVTSPMMLLIDCHWNDVLPSELTTMLCSPDLLLVSSPRFESVTVYLNNQCWAGVNGGWWRWFYGPITVRGRQNILELNIKRLMGPNIKCFHGARNFSLHPWQLHTYTSPFPHSEWVTLPRSGAFGVACVPEPSYCNGGGGRLPTTESVCVCMKEREKEEGTCGSNLVVLLSGSGGESVGQGLRAVWIVSEAAGVRLLWQTELEESGGWRRRGRNEG